MKTIQPNIYDTHSAAWQTTGLCQNDDRFVGLTVDDLMQMIAARYPDGNVPSGFVEAIHAAECAIRWHEEGDGPRYAFDDPRVWWECDLLHGGKTVATLKEDSFVDCDNAAADVLWQALEAAQEEAQTDRQDPELDAFRERKK